MRFFSIFFLFLAWNISWSQTQLKFAILNSCSGEEVTEYEVILNNLNEARDEHLFSSEDYIIQLRSGHYVLSIAFISDGNSKVYTSSVHIPNDSLFIVEVDLPSILPTFTRCLHCSEDLGFHKCDEICNGLEQDYHSNGNLRMKGKFKNGIPKHKIKIYNDSGQLVEVNKYDKNGDLKRTRWTKFTEF